MLVWLAGVHNNSRKYRRNYFKGDNVIPKNCSNSMVGYVGPTSEFFETKITSVPLSLGIWNFICNTRLIPSINIVPVVQSDQFLHLFKQHKNQYRYAQVSGIPGGKMYYLKVAVCAVWVTYITHTYLTVKLLPHFLFQKVRFVVVEVTNCFIICTELWTVTWMVLFGSVIEANTTLCKMWNISVNHFKDCSALHEVDRQTDGRT